MIFSLKKIINFIQKNYIFVNVTFLILALYVIFFPIIEIPFKKIIPSFNECPYLKITGKPCPLCGGTRYIKNLPQAVANKDITYLFHPFGIIIIFLIFEIIFRTYNIVTRKKEKKEKLIAIDLIIHLIALILLLTYIIVKFMN